MPDRPSRHPQRHRARPDEIPAPRVHACTLLPGVRYGSAPYDLDDGHVVGRLAIRDDGRPLDWLRHRNAVVSDTGRRYLWLDLFAN